MKKALKIFFIFLAAIAAIYVVLVIIRMFHFYNLDKTNEQVAKIHNTKLTMDDVLGKNLPVEPGAEMDKTVVGIDANKNGIRDDVELAIFKEYPDSAKTRAALLQYALALQMETMQKVVNKETVTEVIREQSRAYSCVGKILSREDINKYTEEGDKLRSFVDENQRNNLERKKFRKDFVEKIGSYSESENKVCDINFSLLPN